MRFVVTGSCILLYLGPTKIIAKNKQETPQKITFHVIFPAISPNIYLYCNEATSGPNCMWFVAFWRRELLNVKQVEITMKNRQEMRYKLIFNVIFPAV